MKVLRLLLLLALLSRPVSAGEVVIRTSAVPEQPIWVGQKVALQIEVLAADGWVQAHLPEIDLDGAYVLAKESQGVRLNETIDGTSYSGQRYDVFVFPQRAGTLRIPAIPLQLEVKTFGAGAATESQRAATQALELSVAVPPGAAAIRGLISTTALEMTQTWQPADGTFRVGDAIKRMVTLTADDVSGMAFTPEEASAIEGVSIYPSRPTVDDAYDRGELTGRRIETVTYVFEREGAVRLPPRAIAWWNLERHVIETAEVPGLNLVIAAAPLGSRTRGGALPLALLAVWVAVLSAAVVWWRRNRLRQVYARWKVQRETSERAYFRRFEQKVRSGDAKATLSALMAWLDHTQPPPVLLRRFAIEFGDAEALRLAERLLRSVSTDETEELDRITLHRSFVAARRRWRGHRGPRDDALPELNPARR